VNTLVIFNIYIYIYIDDTLIFISNDYNSLTHAKGIMRMV
jgi:hypothetical protein